MEKKQKRRLASFITAMSVFVSTGVFWQLRGIGTAMTDDALVQNKSDMAAALSASDSSLCETNEVWESTLPELTDGLAENAALIAASQLGYTENTLNYTLGDDGCTHKNYSRYGAWFGNPYGDWNTMFTCFCLHYAGVSEADIPFGSGCWAWSLKLNEKGALHPLNKGSPKRGDVLLLDTDLDGKADRSGIISDISEERFLTIEGQVDGAVAECSYSPDDGHIIGYVPVETPESENVSLMEFSAESGSGIKVFASAEQGVFPDGTEMFAADVPPDEAAEKAAGVLGKGADEIEAVAVDISFCSPDGVELEPSDSSAVHVEIVLPEEQKLSGEEYSLLHIEDSGGAEIVENADVSGGGAVFEAESFSIYVVVSGYEDMEKDRAVWLNGQPVSNTADTPYVLYVGDYFELKGYTTHDPNTGVGWFWNYNQSITDQIDGYPKISKEGNRWVHDALFNAKSIGSTQISIDGGEEGYSDFYIKVIERPQIYVNTALGEVHKDYVHEYLNLLHSYRYSLNPEYFICIDSDRPQYIKNGDVLIQNPDGSYEEDGGLRPYRISNNDVFELVTYGTFYDDFYIDKQGTHTHTEALEKVGDTVRELITEGEHKGEYRISAKFRGINYNDSGGIRTGVRIGSEFFYVVVTGNEDYMTHADIEIADGGTYKVEKNVINPDGSVTKTITEYEAYVSDVNECNIYDVSNNVLQTYRSQDYYRHGNPGGAQYELTSNYIPADEYSGEWKLENGDYVRLRNDKNFKLLDAQKAKFDVKLQLHPKTETVQQISSSGNIVSSNSTDISSKEIIELKSVIFDLGRKDIVDAYNKCPVHTGLDFTIKADLNEVLQETLPIYTLPSTGGGGVVPYMITGSAVIIFSFAALLLRKRKEDK